MQTLRVCVRHGASPLHPSPGFAILVATLSLLARLRGHGMRAWRLGKYRRGL